MKRRSIEYDAWMQLRKSIEPPFEDDDEMERFIDGQLIVIHADKEGNELCRAGHYLDADTVDLFDSLCTDVMGFVRDEWGEDYDYSDPDDAQSVIASRLSEIKQALASVIDNLNNYSGYVDDHGSTVAEANSLLALADAVSKSADAFLSNNS